MYKRERKSWLKHLDFTILDIFCMQLALVVAYVMRLGWHLPYFNEPYERLAVAMALIDICVVFFFEPYAGILRRGHFQELNSCITFCTIIFAGVLAYEVATKQTEIYSRKVIFSYWIISMAFVYGGRILLKYLIRSRMKKEKNLSVMILVTTEEYAREALKEDWGMKEDIDRYVAYLVKKAGRNGIELSTLGNKVYEEYADFKISDYGYAQFNQYVKSIDRIEVEQDGTILKAKYKRGL